MKTTQAFSGFVVLLIGCLLAAQFLTTAYDGAYAAPPSARNADKKPAEDRYAKKVADRADRIKGSLDSFGLQISPKGENDKPFYRLLLSVAPLAASSEPRSQFDFMVRIKKEDAERLVNYLIRDEFFLETAYEVRADQEFPPLAPYVQNYVVTLTSHKIRLWEDWGWGHTLVKRLKGLRTVLRGEAAEDMDLLLARLGEM